MTYHTRSRSLKTALVDGAVFAFGALIAAFTLVGIVLAVLFLATSIAEAKPWHTKYEDLGGYPARVAWACNDEMKAHHVMKEWDQGGATGAVDYFRESSCVILQGRPMERFTAWRSLDTTTLVVVGDDPDGTPIHMYEVDGSADKDPIYMGLWVSEDYGSGA